MTARSFHNTKDENYLRLEESSDTVLGEMIGEYSEIFRNLLARWIERCEGVCYKNDRNTEDLILPSNEDWRRKVYYQLVELQRERDAEFAAKRIGEIRPEAEFTSEERKKAEEMNVSETGDKKIFDRALKDTGFWRQNSAIEDREKIVWLLLYDMQGRKFGIRDEVDAAEERKRIFEAAGLTDIDDALLEAKTHLAASISRLRIRGSALKLDDLLPLHLRAIEGVAWDEDAAIGFGWVNTVKIPKKEHFLEEMSKLGLTCQEDEVELDETSYAFDSICPKMINFHERARETLAVSRLVRDHRFVFLERSMCIGAAALAKAIRMSRFCGPVILTHSLAPRHTGYLAGLLTDIDHAGRLLAFGTGNRRCEYETYLKDLGVTLQRCRVFSEEYVSHTATAELERATVVLAAPPCSYTGVKDIVDLAVARGGDTDLLESLTNAYASDDELDHRHPQTFLADQMSTLKYALTRPNVQFLVYEVHTALPSETTEMVQRVVDQVNRMALEKYIREHSKVSKEAKEALEKLNALRKVDQMNSSNITVPNSDLFEIGSIDEIYGENASRTLDAGCFIAVIRRKEMMQFDSLFMIKVAESKGLFGDPKEQQESKQLILDQSPPRPSQIGVRKRAKRVKVEIDRIMAHTFSSLSRSMKENGICPRHRRYNNWKQTIGNSPQVSVSFQVKEHSPKAWQIRKATTSRLSTILSSESPRKKELRAMYSLFSTSPESSSQFDSSTLSNDVLSLTNDSIDNASLTRDKWSHSGSSSTIFKSPILTRALQRVPSERDREEHDEENVYLRLEMRRRPTSTDKTSRLFHPGGSPTNVLDSLLEGA
nr:PREDICTED: uncharacterized protein LOC100880076 isoform X2 [Megachile rotundata]